MDRYRRNAGAVSRLKYQIVWCPKYRRAVLVDAIEARLKKIIQGVTSELGMVVHALAFAPTPTFTRVSERSLHVCPTR